MSITYSDIEQDLIRAFRAGNLETPDIDARFLLEEITKFSRAQLLLVRSMPCPQHKIDEIRAACERRLNGEPVARIIGKREFWGHTFRLSPETLEPRPDSETMIEMVLSRFTDRALPYKFLDLGTGTGCLIAALLKEFPHASGWAVDRSFGAIEQAKKNFISLDLSNRVLCINGSWADSLDGPFDCIVSNPPYIPQQTHLSREVLNHDPAFALFAGCDGLDAYRTLFPSLIRLLTPQGCAFFEFGIDQEQALRKLAENHNLNVITVQKDLGGIPRVLAVNRDK